MRLTIEKLVYGGAGLARTENGVVFVPRTAPGDVVEAELVERKSDYAVARWTALLESSPDRQTPECPNYESAGCCHWQHIRYSRQLEIKEAILRETLHGTRLSPASPDPTPTTDVARRSTCATAKWGLLRSGATPWFRFGSAARFLLS